MYKPIYMSSVYYMSMDMGSVYFISVYVCICLCIYMNSVYYMNRSGVMNTVQRSPNSVCTCAKEWIGVCEESACVCRNLCHPMSSGEGLLCFKAVKINN